MSIITTLCFGPLFAVFAPLIVGFGAVVSFSTIKWLTFKNMIARSSVAVLVSAFFPNKWIATFVSLIVAPISIWLINDIFDDYYIYIISFIGPLFMLLESYELTKFSLLTGRLLKHKTEENVFRSVVMILSFISISIAAALLIYLFTSDQDYHYSHQRLLTWGTLLCNVGCIVGTIVVDDGIISDAALLLLMSCFHLYHIQFFLSLGHLIGSVIFLLITVLSFGVSLGDDEWDDFSEHDSYDSESDSENISSRVILFKLSLILAFTYAASIGIGLIDYHTAALWRAGELICMQLLFATRLAIQYKSELDPRFKKKKND
eukprot:gb/GECH01002566.1/.p1 GENE.gb/GECH01002566.1/~~gb/GECH01002566.1/.p1  ORF type:complete len:318 (+),score=33.53 gb/GECH01002566.1/:1-954(+)